MNLLINHCTEGRTCWTVFNNIIFRQQSCWRLL